MNYYFNRRFLCAMTFFQILINQGERLGLLAKYRIHEVQFVFIDFQGHLQNTKYSIKRISCLNIFTGMFFSFQNFRKITEDLSNLLYAGCHFSVAFGTAFIVKCNGVYFQYGPSTKHLISLSIHLEGTGYPKLQKKHLEEHLKPS